MKLWLVMVCLMALLCQAETAFSGIKFSRLLKNNYSLVGNNLWAQFPQLILEFQLESPRLLALSYVIAAPSDLSYHLCTRLIIDGTEDQHFRATTGNTIYHSHSVSGFIYLREGKHQIKVEYRTPSAFTNIPPYDSNTASLQINY